MVPTEASTSSTKEGRNQVTYAVSAAVLSPQSCRWSMHLAHAIPKDATKDIIHQHCRLISNKIRCRKNRLKQLKPKELNESRFLSDSNSSFYNFYGRTICKTNESCYLCMHHTIQYFLLTKIVNNITYSTKLPRKRVLIRQNYLFLQKI